MSSLAVTVIVVALSVSLVVGCTVALYKFLQTNNRPYASSVAVFIGSLLFWILGPILDLTSWAINLFIFIAAWVLDLLGYMFLIWAVRRSKTDSVRQRHVF